MLEFVGCVDPAVVLPYIPCARHVFVGGVNSVKCYKSMANMMYNKSELKSDVFLS
jgi:hypothetical protein